MKLLLLAALALACLCGPADAKDDLTVLALEACTKQDACMTVLIPLINPMTGATLTTQQCAVHSQAIAAEWAKTHRPWMVRKITCFGKPPGVET